MKQILKFFLGTIALLILSEGGLRLMGYAPWSLPQSKFVSTPPSCILSHDSLGFALHPGAFEVSINQLNFSTTHTPTGIRTTHYTGEPDSAHHTIHIHGGSYAYGFGINDEQTFPYILNGIFPALHIENHAVPGYGEVQALLLLQKQMMSNTLPAVVVICYNDFHSDRNALNKTYRQQLHTGLLLHKHEGIKDKNDNRRKYPYAKINQDQLNIEFEPFDQLHEPMWLRNYSALMNLVESALMRLSHDEASDKKITNRVLLAMHQICRENEVRLVVGFMNDDPAVEAFVKENAIESVNMKVDLAQEGYRNLPYDPHPSAFAHRDYAKKLQVFLKEL